MPRRPKAIEQQIIDPPDFEAIFNQYAQGHGSENTIAFLDGAVTIFGIIEEMLYAKLNDGSRWTEGREKAYFKISHFIREKGELFDRIVPEFEELRQSLSLPGQTPYTSIVAKKPK
ncbi:hypothetical protein [Mucilaginibacter psychrotolerans]|uniref:Uncharacterized protein n=1 Tax=Mucilaginibacter psychrotolerans TaxID=1524096 RepID=A0A4Y8SFP8_9SPHI|nr:hypothetical protein [Mucilaginibacter psychrotolerans]TFF37274.1 hypothetical protein E2R66_12620 [Mucilaginibacter psychrotolerans]